MSSLPVKSRGHRDAKLDLTESVVTGLNGEENLKNVADGEDHCVLKSLAAA